MSRRRRPIPEQRGFALLVVVLLVALMSITGAALLDVVNVDQTLNYAQQRSRRAFAIADTGAFELITSTELRNRLPVDWGMAQEKIDFPGGADAMLTDSVVSELRGEYDTTVTLLGERQVSENSINRVVTLTWDVEVVGRTNPSGQVDARSEVRTRIMKMVPKRPGTITVPQYLR